MNILLAVDGSESSTKVVERLAKHVGELREIPVIHVLYVHLPIPPGFATRYVGHEVIENYYQEEGLAITRPVVDRLAHAGVAATAHVKVGSPGETIALTAQELRCDAIWMGTHGRGAVTQALLGSVAARVVSLTHIPVTLVR